MTALSESVAIDIAATQEVREGSFAAVCAIQAVARQRRRRAKRAAADEAWRAAAEDPRSGRVMMARRVFGGNSDSQVPKAKDRPLTVEDLEMESRGGISDARIQSEIIFWRKVMWYGMVGPELILLILIPVLSVMPASHSLRYYETLNFAWCISLFGAQTSGEWRHLRPTAVGAPACRQGIEGVPIVCPRLSCGARRGLGVAALLQPESALLTTRAVGAPSSAQSATQPPTREPHAHARARPSHTAAPSPHGRRRALHLPASRGVLYPDHHDLAKALPLARPTRAWPVSRGHERSSRRRSQAERLRARGAGECRVGPPVAAIARRCLSLFAGLRASGRACARRLRGRLSHLASPRRLILLLAQRSWAKGSGASPPQRASPPSQRTFLLYQTEMIVIWVIPPPHR